MFSRVLNCSVSLLVVHVTQTKISIRDFVRKVCDVDVTDRWDILVYDQSSSGLESVSLDSFLHVLLAKLVGAFRSVSLLKGTQNSNQRISEEIFSSVKCVTCFSSRTEALLIRNSISHELFSVLFFSGGFLAFQAAYPELCEDKGRRGGIGASGGGGALLGSFSQPCLPVTNVGPTRILPFLYLGSQQDATNQDLLQVRPPSFFIVTRDNEVVVPYCRAWTMDVKIAYYSCVR